MMRRALLILAVVLWGCSGAGTSDSATPPPDTGEEVVEEEPTDFEVTGTVLDQNGTPLADASVLVGGRPETVVQTDAKGAFALWYTHIDVGLPAVVASKVGYRSIGYEFFQPDTPITLTLREVSPPDNEAYVFQDPGTGFDDMQEDCSHCHTGFVLDFFTSKHSESAWNPLVQDLYAGVSSTYTDETSCVEAGGRWAQGVEPGTTSAMEKCYLGTGVLADLNETCGGESELTCDDPSIASDDAPVEFGGCADCHAPGIDGKAGGRNLHDAVGLAYDAGIHCDVCHKVKEVDLEAPAGIGSRLLLGRPNEPGDDMRLEWDPVYYGPLIDVPNVLMGGSYQPQFDDAVFCAGCHEDDQDALLPGESLDSAVWPDGLPIQTTYTEWLEGPYNQEETPCQFCHMPADVERTNSLDIATFEDQSITFGFPREPEDIRQHLFRGPLDGEPRLIDQSVYVSVSVEEDGGDLEATVSVANMGCGHAIPTGEPMRALVLVIEVDSACGTFTPSGGMTISDVGGALAQAVEGSTVYTTGVEMSWPGVASVAAVGQVVRAVWPTGEFHDYAGVGKFGDGTFTAEEKGMEVMTPVSEASIVAVDGDILTLSTAMSLQEGDLVYLGEAWGTEVTDGQDALHLAGMPGYTFAKVLVDSSGSRQVPHYRAIDIESDNRVSPGTNALTTHRFLVPEGCSEADVSATLLYRPVPLTMSQARGWTSQDWVIATSSIAWESGL